MLYIAESPVVFFIKKRKGKQETDQASYELLFVP